VTFGPNPVWRYGHADQIVEPDDCASTPQPYQPVFRRRGWRGRGLGADLPRDKPGQERVDSRKVATVLAAQYHPAFAVPDFALLSALCDHVQARGDDVDVDGNWVILSPTGKELARAS